MKNDDSCGVCCRGPHNMLNDDFCIGCQRDALLESCKTLRDVAALAFQTVAENGLTDFWLHRLACHEIPTGFGALVDDVISKCEGEERWHNGHSTKTKKNDDRPTRISGEKPQCS